MVKRCPGTKVSGEWTGFQCVLDEGHAERFCQPYVPPTVDEWRVMKADRDRLQAELDALRAVVESGRDLDAEVLRGVKTHRDNLAGSARKGDV